MTSLRAAIPALLLFLAALSPAGATVQATQPTIKTAASRNGAQIVTITAATGAKIYYTLTGSTPTTSSQRYLAPVLVAAPLTVKAVASQSGKTLSKVATYTFATKIASGTLVWSDEFANATKANLSPSSTTWTYDTGSGGWGNKELETYCAAGSNTSPCSTSKPNAYIDTAGILHIVARKVSSSVYTSARMKSEGRISFQYGRFEARIKVPESQGMWPAFWMLGNNIETVSWPACGELDIMEHIDGSRPSGTSYDWIAGSIHGASLNASKQYTLSGFSAAAWHTYGMIWTKGQVQFYVDSPSKVYATFKRASVSGTWPFEDGPEFFILNLAVGGSWPGSPNSSTVFPSEYLVDYVRVYTN